ncbi:MAG: IPT/TIG domain-containing protein [Acidobacteria bacterium]|nr:IPT/TIG domain-containing protein [Acidobacteriota bacterium]
MPRGVTGMQVQVEASGPVRAFIRFRSPVDIDGGNIVSDYFVGDGRSLNGTVSLSSTPELQAGEYYFNVANTTSTQVEYAIRITLVNDPAGVGASFPVISSGVPVTGSVPSNYLNTRQFRVVVPVGATALDLELSGDQDVDLYVNFGNPVQPGGEGLPLAEGISASASSTERMTLLTSTVPNLRPGTYFVAVQNYSLAATAKFTLRATLRNDAVYAPSQDVVGPSETRNLFLPVSTNTGILLTRQFRIDTQAAWRGLNLRVASNSNLLLLVKRNQPVRFANGVPDADARYVIQNETKTFTLDGGSNPAFQQGSYYVAILSLSERGGTVSFDYTAVLPAAGGPAIAAVVDGAGFTRQISPGSWITITGTALAASTRIWGGADFIGTALPTQLDGVSVTVGGVPAFVYFISPGQLNVLVPQSLRTGNLDVVVTTRGGRSAVFVVSSVAAVPALFRFDPQGRRYAAAVFVNGAYAGPAGLFGSALATRPANRGEVVQLFATGLGAVGSVDGITNEPLVNITNRVTATLGGVSARVTFAGRVGAGLYQINLEVPVSLGAGDQALRISIAGVQSDAGVFLAVQ